MNLHWIFVFFVFGYSGEYLWCVVNICGCREHNEMKRRLFGRWRRRWGYGILLRHNISLFVCLKFGPLLCCWMVKVGIFLEFPHGRGWEQRADEIKTHNNCSSWFQFKKRLDLQVDEMRYYQTNLTRYIYEYMQMQTESTVEAHTKFWNCWNLFGFEKSSCRGWLHSVCIVSQLHFLFKFNVCVLQMAT